MKYPRIALITVVLAGSISQNIVAEAFKAHPKAGLWQSDAQLLIDGVDVLAQMQALQEQMLARLPESARQEAKKSMGNDNLSCISQAQAEEAKDIDKWLQQVSQEGCQLQKTGETATSVDLTVQCDGSSGYSGQYSGKLVAKDDKSWTMTMNGKGTMSGGSKPVTQQISVTGTWLAADCGDVDADDE